MVGRSFSLSKKKYKIGTRSSLLALTQSQQVKENLEELTGDEFELVKIKTEGDLNTSVPLWQLDGKDFFTKELDQALLNHQVDLVIHSYKDLGSERPEGITLAAITKRKYQNDILLIKNKTIKELQSNSLKDFVIGTSSPRRIENLKSNILNFLPVLNNKDLKLEVKSLRGNINSRIRKLQEDNYDAIVLALAGVERLALTKSSHVELTKLLNELNYMILPISHFPTAASQGALCIETLDNRGDQDELLKKIQLLNDEKTISEVRQERKSFKEYGGGCHLAVGISVQKINNNFLQIQKGCVDNKVINQTFVNRESKLPELKGKKVFLGLYPKHIFFSQNKYLSDQLTSKHPLLYSEKLSSQNVYITSILAKDTFENIQNPNQVWTSGAKTFTKLAKQQFWINGTADGLGENYLANLIASKAISIMNKNDTDWITLTNKESSSNIGEVIESYKRTVNSIDESFSKAILDREVFYWTSYWQYTTYIQHFPSIKDKIHCCGFGKTYYQFLNNQIGVYPFFNVDSFRQEVTGEKNARITK